MQRAHLLQSYVAAMSICFWSRIRFGHGCIICNVAFIYYMLGQGLWKSFCECVCDKVMELLCTLYILFFVLVHFLLFLAFFIFYVCGIPLKVNIYCEKNADWLYNHSYRLGQIFTKGFKLASLVWCYWEKVWHYLCDLTWLKIYYWFPMRRHMDNLLNTYDVLIHI